MSNLQLLSSRFYMWSETEPGTEQLACIGACLSMLAQLLFTYLLIYGGTMYHSLIFLSVFFFFR